MNEELFLQDNASLGTREATVTIQQIVCLHPLYNNDLVSPNCHLFGPLKDAILQTMMS